MRDTTADLHATAVTVPCRYCGAAVGEKCVNKTTDPVTVSFIPHAQRLRDSQEVPF